MSDLIQQVYSSPEARKEWIDIDSKWPKVEHKEIELWYKKHWNLFFEAARDAMIPKLIEDYLLRKTKLQELGYEGFEKWMKEKEAKARAETEEKLGKDALKSKPVDRELIAKQHFEPKFEEEKVLEKSKEVEISTEK